LRNKFEKSVAKQLKRLKVAFTYETEKFAYTLSSTYMPDFILNVSSGKIYVECKGYLRPEDKRN